MSAWVLLVTLVLGVDSTPRVAQVEFTSEAACMAAANAVLADINRRTRDGRFYSPDVKLLLCVKR
jgi:hypothetical protein